MKQSKNNSPTLTEDLQVRANEIWDSLRVGTGFSDEVIAAEKERIQTKITELEQQIDEKKQLLKEVDKRRDSARKQLDAMLIAGLSDDAILSAMRVQYKVKRSAGGRGKSASRGGAAAVTDEVRQQVLDHLDSEGLTAAEIRKQVGPVSPTVSTVLKALVADGAVIKEGEGKTARYKLGT